MNMSTQSLTVHIIVAAEESNWANRPRRSEFIADGTECLPVPEQTSLGNCSVLKRLPHQLSRGENHGPGDCYRDIGAPHDSQGPLRGAVSVRKFGSFASRRPVGGHVRSQTSPVAHRNAFRMFGRT